jgi:cell wall-associated NlpC family hydrolase
MSTIAWIFILAAGILLRAVNKGRVMNLGEDLSDGFLAFASGDIEGLNAVLARTGSANVATTATPPAEGEASRAPGAGSNRDNLVGNQRDMNAAILAKAIALGKAAKGYRLTATGPDYYDCSGLVWRAVQSVGFTGVRFTTADVKLRKGFHQIDAPTTGDIVLWPTHHMGVATTAGKFYSARNPRSGISEASIKGFRKEAPIYLRYTGV